MRDEHLWRAHRRRRTEEIMGWICVPVILVICYVGWQAWDQIASERPQLRDARPVPFGVTPVGQQNR
jgi:hypothetical protein